MKANSYRAARRRSRGWIAGLLILALLAPVGSRGEESMDEIMAAFKEVAEKGANASGRAQAIAFKHNLTLQHLRIAAPDRISDAVYQANQANFARINDQLLQNAASQNGLSYTPQQTKPGKMPTPGTDTDAIMRPAQQGQPMTADQISRARQSYNQGAQEFLEKNGVKTGGKPPNTNTSLLPDPTQMKESEWRKAIDEAARLGEVVYKDPLAASAEAKIRAGQPLTVAEANARVNQVSQLAQQHFAEADRLDAAARNLPPGPERQALEAQAQIMRHNGAKYITRITETGQAMVNQVGGRPIPPPSETVAGLSVRDPANRMGAAAAGAMGEHFAAQATQNYIQNMAKAAAASGDPRLIAESQRAIAQALQTLPPSAQGNVLDSLRQTHGPTFAKNVAEAARGLPKPPPPNAPPGKLATASKYLGPAMILYGGGRSIYEVATSTNASYTAGKKLGEFACGTAGAAAGGFAGAKVGGALGAAIGSVVPGIGTALGGTIGALAGGLYGGIKGYGFGAAHGSEMGDTNSKYWDKNLSDEEFNRRAMANGLMPADQVLDKLIGMGVPPDRAAALAALYKNGSLKEFRSALRSLRNEMVASGRWHPSYTRRFTNLGTNEVSELLHCLCSASLGANPWVAQGYNTTIPPGSEGYACGDLGNGPCMAQGFGCWRSFINFQSEEAKQCFESFGMEPDPYNIGSVHSAYQQKYVKPFKSVAHISPLRVCPGDKVTINMETEGGMGDYMYQYEVGGWPLIKPEDMPDPHTRTPKRSFTLTVDPTLRRGFFDGQWVYTRPAEAYTTYIRVRSISHTYERGHVVQLVADQVTPVTLMPHDECEKLKSPQRDEPGKPPPKKTEPSSGPGPHIGTPPAGGGPPRAPASEPKEEEETTIPGYTPTGSKKATSGKAPKTSAPVAPVPSDTKTPAGTDHAKPEALSAPPTKPQDDHPRGPQKGDDSGWGTRKGWTVPGSATNQTTESKPPTNAPVECSITGGGYGLAGQPAVLFAEGPPSNRVRITITGSDGFNQSAEGIGKAELSRPPNPNGSDVIVIEDLDTPGCRDAIRRSYGPDGMPIAQEPITGEVTVAGTDLKGAEGALGQGQILATPGSAADSFVRGFETKAAARTQTGLGLLDAHTQLGNASRAGDATLAGIGQIRDSAGAAAQDTRAATASKIAADEAANSWGNVLGDSLAKGVQQGLSQAASAFGSEAADRAASEIFDHGRRREPPVRVEDSPAGVAVKTHGASPKADHTAQSEGKPKPPRVKKPQEPSTPHESGEILVTPDGAIGPAGAPLDEPPSKAVTVTCPSCGVTSTFPDGNVPPWCPNCCAGPNSTECAHCGYRWCGKNGPPPPVCPQCGARDAGPEPPHSTEGGSSTP